MPGALPEGEPAPSDGRLPESILAEAAATARGLSAYVHIPICASRCGYCDFTTYTAAEWGTGATREAYVEGVLAEIRLAGRVLREAGGSRHELPGPLHTVFFGGGTPTVLPAAQLVRILHALDQEFGLAADAEVTTEANPESVDLAALEVLRAGGFTRLSLGMQSAAPHVLATLERQHSPGRVAQVAEWARQAGFEHLNLDLIYGTPGESDQDWADSLATAVAARPDHISAYSLIVEPGTRLHRRVARGELPMPEDDVLAERYLQAERYLAAHKYQWYEVSNWAKGQQAHCRHNRAYWRGENWWGFGCGAHSHLAGGVEVGGLVEPAAIRWWNVRHPRDYLAALGRGHSPAAGRELLTGEQRYQEDVLLRLRLAEGLPLNRLNPHAQAAADQAAQEGLLDAQALTEYRAVLTLQGRLLADAVVRKLLE